MISEPLFVVAKYIQSKAKKLRNKIEESQTDVESEGLSEKEKQLRFMSKVMTVVASALLFIESLPLVILGVLALVIVVLLLSIFGALGNLFVFTSTTKQVDTSVVKDISNTPLSGEVFDWSSDVGLSSLSPKDRALFEHVKLVYETKELTKSSAPAELLVGIPTVECSGLFFLNYNKAGGGVKSLLSDYTDVHAEYNGSGCVGPMQIMLAYKSSWLAVPHPKYAPSSTSDTGFKSEFTARPSVLFWPDLVWGVFGVYGIKSSEYPKSKGLRGCEPYISNALKKFGFSPKDEKLRQELYAMYYTAQYHGGGTSADFKKSYFTIMVACMKEAGGSILNLGSYGADSESVTRVKLLGDTNYQVKRVDPFTINGHKLNKSLFGYVRDKYASDPEVTWALDYYQGIRSRASSNGNLFVSYSYGMSALINGRYRIEKALKSVNLKFAFGEDGDLDVRIDSASNEQAGKLAKEGESNQFESDAGMFKRSYEATKEKLNNFYKGSLDVSSKTVVIPYPDKSLGSRKIEAPVYEEGDKNAGGIVNAYYSIAVTSDVKYLKSIPTKYTTNGAIKYWDSRLEPIVTAMIEDVKAADLGTLKVSDCFRSQTRQAILFVQAECNGDLRRLNKDDQVQKWLASKTGKTVEELKKGDISGINWDKLRESIYSKGTPSYISSYCTYVGIPSGVNAHSTGRAFDFDGMTPKIKQWLEQRAKYYGFYNYSRESWHWEYNLVP